MNLNAWLAALALAVPTLAGAQAQGGPPAAGDTLDTYVAVRLGAIIPKHKDLEGFDNGFAFEGAFGYRASENVALELSVGRFSMSASGQAYISGVLANVHEDIEAYPVLATLRAILPVDQLELFGLIGGGIYFMSAKGEATAPGYMPLTASDSDNPFGLHLGGGVNVRLSPRSLLGADVKYVIGTTKMWDSSSGFDSIIVSAGLTYRL